MAWDPQQQDPHKGPWGSRPVRPIRPVGGGGGGPQGGGSGRPPGGGDFDEWLRRGQEQFRRRMGGSGSGDGRSRAVLILGVLAVWLVFGGMYHVDPDELGVETRFGAFQRITEPGLNYHLPWPIEAVQKSKVTRVNSLEIGYRSNGSGAQNFPVPEESLMLTGDENIVNIQFEVQWKIRDIREYLFNVRDSEETVKIAAESAMREVIGKNPIARVLSDGRSNIEFNARNLLQDTLTAYKSGVEIVRLQMLPADPPEEVIEAFRDVQNARADKERLINEAQAYRNDVLPKARGHAERILQEAEGYQRQVVAQAEGEAARFTSVYNEYVMAKDVTRKRIYLETMESIFNGMPKMILSDGVSDKVLPYLPLPEMKSAPKPAEGGQ
jgi:membrane protease subunit HflK